jgi:hypothetical protein
VLFIVFRIFIQLNMCFHHCFLHVSTTYSFSFGIYVRKHFPRASFYFVLLLHKLFIYTHNMVEVFLSFSLTHYSLTLSCIHAEGETSIIVQFVDKPTCKTYDHHRDMNQFYKVNNTHHLVNLESFHTQTLDSAHKNGLLFRKKVECNDINGG